MGILLDTKVTRADQASPACAILTGRNARQLPCVQSGDSNLCDLVMSTLVGLHIDAHEDDGLIEIERCR